MRGENGRPEAPSAATPSAALTIACSRTRSASRTSGAVSAAANGAPFTSAMPSFSAGSYGATPRDASASAAGTLAPSSSTKPSPTKRLEQVREQRDLAGGAVRPAGTSGSQPSLSRSAMKLQSAPLTPAAPPRKPVSRRSIAPRTTSRGSGGPTATARPRRIERCNASLVGFWDLLRREIAEAGRDAVRRHALRRVRRASGPARRPTRSSAPASSSICSPSRTMRS